MAAESKLQSKIIHLLEADGWLVIKTIQLSKNGFPDIFAFRNSKAIFIEVKSPNGKASELQKYRIEQLQNQGFTAFICNSLDEFKAKIQQ
jgi:Holliday junction resolvase